MIPKECKRLAEVDFPIAVVSKHAAKEKQIRFGHPSTLHLWWARRPLAACRAMLMALLLPDPGDEHCPKEFRAKARELFGKPMSPISKVGPKDENLRKALLDFIGDFADWDNSSKPVYLEISRALVKAAHPEETPLVVDPFAGGGSIPLEALRLGCDAFASDLNPVACLILKVMLEDIPRHGPQLADEFRRVGGEIKAAAEKQLAEFYPADPDGARPIAYLWARTVRCETPGCGAEIPLVRSFWLCKKANRRRALRTKVIRSKGKPPEVELETFEAAGESEVQTGTVSRAKATCLACNTVLAPDRVRAQLRDQRGGADVIFDGKGNRKGGALLLAVVTLQEGERGRQYRLPTDKDYKAVWKATKKLAEVAAGKLSGGLCPVPDEPLPPIGTLGFRVQRYGMMQWGDLFTARQKLALFQLIRESRSVLKSEELSEWIGNVVSLVLSKHAELMSANCPWEAVAECPRKTYNMQALPIRWEFAEGVATSDSSGGIEITFHNSSSTLDAIGSNWAIGSTALADACKAPLHHAASLWFTDPPYYDAVPYSDLSDLFFVWLKRLLPDSTLMRDPFDPTNKLTPKNAEIVQDEARKVDGLPKDQQFFERRMGLSFGEGRNTLRDEGVACVVFAHKTTEGWEALIGGLLRAGWVIHASWPIQTEQAHRPRARDSAALSASVHLVCRPRAGDAAVGDWANVLHELPKKVGEWMERLQSEGVRGADLVFACIGPALEIYSRYSKVETAEGQEIKLDVYLQKVWEVVGRIALEQVLGTAEAKARNGAAGVLEEDARLTALFLWTLQSTAADAGNSAAKGQDEEEDEDTDNDEEEAPRSKAKGSTLVFDVVRRFAQPLGIHLPDWEGRIIETKKGTVRLLPVGERAKQLFGEDGAQAVADRIESDAKRPQHVQLSLFPDEPPAVKPRKGRRKKGDPNVPDKSLQARREATTLDRIHAAMLLQSSGRANALRALLQTEQDRGPDFLRLANALSALYPTGSEEKRLLDAMLLAVPK